MKRLSLILSLLLAIVVVGFVCTAVAFGADAAVLTVPDPGADPGGYFARLLSFVTGGVQGQALAATLLIGVVWAARKWGQKLAPWLATGRGGAALALVTGILGAFANCLLAGNGWPSAGLLFEGLRNGVLAAGGWTAIHHLFGIDSSAPGGSASKAPG